MPFRRREVRQNGFDANQYETLADKGYDSMEIEDLLECVDEERPMFGIDDFDDPEEEDDLAPPAVDDRPCRKHGEPCPVRHSPCPFSAKETDCRFSG